MPRASSPEPATGPALLRITVVSSTQRADLLVPATVPVAELVPDLASAVGLADRVAGGHRLTALGGGALTDADSLTDQGVVDGALLVLAEADHAPPPIDDDLALAVAAVVEQDLPHRPEDGSGTATATVVSGVGGMAAIAFATTSSAVGAVAAAGTSLALAAAGRLTVQRQGGRELGRVLGWLAVLHAGVAGVVVAGDDIGTEVLAAGVAVAVLGMVVVVAIDRILLPSVVAGAALAAAGLCCVVGGTPTDVTLTVAVALVVISGEGLATLAATTSGLHAGSPGGSARATPGDRDRVTLTVRRAHARLAALLTAQGMVLVVTVPAAVSRGVAGTLLAGAAVTVLLLRARRHRVARTARAAGRSALAGTAAAVVAVWWCHPEWRLGLAVALVGCTAAVVTRALAPLGGSLRLGRLGELLEGLALVALLPLLLLATGVLGLVQELVP